MTAVVHLTDNQTVTIENLIEVRANPCAGMGASIFPVTEIKNFELTEKALCTFVGEESTIAFSIGVICFVEFKKD